MTLEGVSRLLAFFESIYGRQTTPAQAAAWLAVLTDVGDDDGVAAALEYAKASHFFPTPADLITIIRGDPKNAERLLDEEATLALVHLEQHISDFTYIDYGQPINATIRMMGGIDVIAHLMASGEWKFFREEFRKIYRGVRRSPLAGVTGPPLPMAVSESHPADLTPEDRRFTPTPIPSIDTGRQAWHGLGTPPSRGRLPASLDDSEKAGDTE